MVGLFDALATLAIHLELSICIICKSSCSLPIHRAFLNKLSVVGCASLPAYAIFRCKCVPVYVCMQIYSCMHAQWMYGFGHFHRENCTTMYDANRKWQKQLTLPSDVIITFLFFLLWNVFMLLFPVRSTNHIISSIPLRLAYSLFLTLPLFFFDSFMLFFLCCSQHSN